MPRKLLGSPRIRIKSDQEAFKFLGPVSLFNPDGFRYPAGTNHEEIRDVVGFPQLWNACYHEVAKQTAIHMPQGHVYWNGEIVISSYDVDDYSVLDDLREHCPLPPIELIDDLAVKAEQTFVKATDTETSLLNFLIEMIESLTNIGKAISSLASKWDSLMELARRLYDKFRKEGKTHPESLWLAWNFAVKPTISDLKALFSGIRDARKRLEYLKRVNHKTTTKHFRRKEVWSPGDVEVDIPYFASHDPSYVYPFQITPPDSNGVEKRTEFKFRLKLASYKLDFHCQADVLYDIDDAYLDDTLGLGIVWSAMNGLYNPEAILWEACPFSWLADYFFSARQKLIHQMFDLSPLKDGVIQRACHSWRLRSKWDVYLVAETISFYHGNEVNRQVYVSKMSTLPYDVYTRHEGLPSVEEVPLRVPKWNQLSNLFALLIQLFRPK